LIRPFIIVYVEEAVHIIYKINYPFKRKWIIKGIANEINKTNEINQINQINHFNE